MVSSEMFSCCRWRRTQQTMKSHCCLNGCLYLNNGIQFIRILLSKSWKNTTTSNTQTYTPLFILALLFLFIFNASYPWVNHDRIQSRSQMTDNLMYNYFLLIVSLNQPVSTLTRLSCHSRDSFSIFTDEFPSLKAQHKPPPHDCQLI